MFMQVKIVFLQWLPCVLRMSRPGKKITKKTILMSNRMKELELQERSSKSLLANVLDIDDDFRHGNSAANPASGYIRYHRFNLSYSSRFAKIPWCGRDLTFIFSATLFSLTRAVCFSPFFFPPFWWIERQASVIHWKQKSCHVFNLVAKNVTREKKPGTNAYNNLLWAIEWTAGNTAKTNETRIHAFSYIRAFACA